MTKANLKAAIDLISDQIRDYETADTTQLRDIQADIISTGLKVLSAVTGHEYRWTRQMMKNKKLYSAVCRTMDGVDVEVYDNRATNEKALSKVELR